MDQRDQLTQRIREWLDRLANTEGVLSSESQSHISRMSHEFGEPEEAVRIRYRRLTSPYLCPTCVD